MALIGHKSPEGEEVVKCMHLNPIIIGDHIIKVCRLGIGIHIQVCLLVHHGFGMVLGYHLDFYILIGLHQDSMLVIGCHCCVATIVIRHAHILARG